MPSLSNLLGRGFYGVRTDEIAVLEVEPVQLVAGLLRVHDILVDDEGGAFGVVRDALADLAGGFVSGLQTSCAIGERVATHRTGPNLPKRSNSSSGVTL